MVALIDGYDAALFDLDGVVYSARTRCPEFPPRWPSGQATRLMYVTNNAARPAATVVISCVARHRRRAGSVLTSAQVAASALADELPPGAKFWCAVATRWRVCSPTPDSTS